MLLTGASWAEVELATGRERKEIVKAFDYHVRREALERKRERDPAYQHLVVAKRIPVVGNSVRCEPAMSEDEALAVSDLYRPKQQMPEHLAKKYGGRKAFG